MKLPRTIAHLDFKGVQRRPEALLAHLETLSGLGYDAILVEYEDVFPFKNTSFATEKEIVWSREQLTTFLERADSLGLKVIPLQQSLAHLEYIFRWDAYRPYSLKHPVTGEWIETTTLDIASGEAREWLKGLLQEVIQAHPQSQFVHLGMDESWALGVYARDSGKAPLGLFLEWLTELCALCRSLGKTPLIWSDMIEDHLDAANLDRLLALKDKVVLVHWDYTASRKPNWEAHFSGWRTSRHWLEEVRTADEITLRPHHQWMEEWEPAVADLAKEYRVGEHHLSPLFQTAVWKKLGFRVLGACAIAMMMEGPFIPRYHRRMNNIDLWRERISEWGLDGLIVTAWARGGTMHPPTVLPDLHLPMLAYAAGKAEGEVFGTTSHLPLALLGRCVESWGLLSRVTQELEACAVCSHHDAWKTLLLSVQLQRLHSETTGLIHQVAGSRYANRFTWLEWTHRLAACRERREALQALRGEMDAHLRPRFYGDALKEWFANAFDIPVSDLHEAEETIMERIADARQKFSVSEKE